MVPKVELHLHLDCSLSYEVARQLAPGLSRERFDRELAITAPCPDLAEFLSKVAPGLALLQSREALTLLTRDLFRRLQADGVLYAELRFAPLLHTEEGLAPEEVVATVTSAASDAGRASGVGYGIILCTLRHFSSDQSLRTAVLAERFREVGVVAIDIAGDEAGFALDEHVAAFRFARERGLHITAHAGEARGPSSVYETLERLRPTRIGHGVRSIEDPALIELLKERGIHLEICPTSNVLTTVVDAYDAHPVDRLVRAGVSIGISTDCRGLIPVTLEEEYRNLTAAFAWGEEQFRSCNVAAARACFAPSPARQGLLERLETIAAD